VVLSIKAVIVRAIIGRKRMKAFGTPACLGRLAGLAERRARSRLGQLEHAAREGTATLAGISSIWTRNWAVSRSNRRIGA